jgi:hypothetical protein
MATPDDGLLVAMYGPSEVTAHVACGTVSLVEETNYPFEDSVTFTLKGGGGVFPLDLRVPSWIAGPVELTVNGVRDDRLSPAKPGSIVRVERHWTKGDVVTVRLPMEVRTKKWTANHDSVSVDYGPLTFSLRIGEKYVKVASGETAVHDAKWQPGANPKQWPSFEIHPTTSWNYALTMNEFVVHRKPWPKSDYPFDLDGAPIEITTKARQVPEWTLDETGLCAELQASPVKTEEPIVTVTLVPMGAARLRVSAFPVAGEDGTVWKKHAAPIRLYRAAASHTWGGDQVAAVADGIEPKSSNDQGVPRHTFWPHNGTAEWITATFDTPREIRECSVYWFDDTGDGECRVPASWSIEWLDGEAWRPVRARGPFGLEKDKYNRVPFEPVVTTALRLKVQLQKDFSAGVLEWRVPERRH